VTEVDRLEKWAEVPRDLAEIVALYSERYGIPINELRGPSRKADRVWVRRNIAKLARGRRQPFSYWQIGRALNRDSSTVRNLVARPHGTRNGVKA
jgi:chromosomal replication initiation ATPase DnaA